MRKWLWLPALLAAAGGVASLVQVPRVSVPGVVLFAIPFVAAVAVTAWAGRHHTAAAAAGVGGTVGMAIQTWWEVSHWPTEAAAWQLNNDLQFATCRGVNYLILAVVGVMAMVLGRPRRAVPGNRGPGVEPKAKPI